MFYRALKIVLFLLWPLIGLTAAEYGAPFITNFSPRDYGGSNQNWCIAQDQRGIIYVANGRGVLEFDGVRWRRIPLANNAAALSIGITSDNTIFVGGKGDFGRLEPAESGRLRFRSLKPLLDSSVKTFGDVWEIVITDSMVFFRTASYLFGYKAATLTDNEKIVVWRPRNRFHVAFRIKESLYIRDKGIGLQGLKQDSLKLLEGGQRFADESIFAGVSLAEKILLITSSQGVIAYEGGDFIHMPSPAGEFIKKHQGIHATAISDDMAAIATNGGGILFIDAKGRIIHHIDRSTGLGDDTVWFVLKDQQGGLWCALNNGLSRVEFPSPITLYDDRHGLNGAAQDITRFDETIYVATSPGGVFRLQAKVGKDDLTRERFVKVKGISTQTWAFAQIEKRLIVAANTGIHEIHDLAAQPILPEEKLEAVYLKASGQWQGVLFVGLFNGLAILNFDGQRWRLVNRFDFGDEIRSIVENGTGNLWLGTRASGIYQLKLSPHSPYHIAEQNHYGSEAGVPSGQAIVYLLNGKLLATTEDRGVITFNPELQQFQPTLLFGEEYSYGDVDVEIIAHRNGSDIVWLGAAESGVIIEMNKDETGNYYRVDNALNRLPYSAIRSIYEEDGAVWFGTNDGLYRFDRSLNVNTGKFFDTAIREITLLPDSLIYYGEQRPEKKILFATPFAHTAFRFEFAAIFYDGMTHNRYQTRMVGFEKSWSQWTYDTSKEYTNLSPGKYTFEIRAQNTYNTMGFVDSVTFQILPPWYRTIWAYSIYATLLAGMVFAADRYQRRRLLKRARLRTQIALQEAENQRRIEELEEARRLQLSMLPKDIPQVPGMSIAAFMQTATEVGGDLYDFIHTDRGLTGVIGDATGHGLNAGMMVSIIKALFVSEAQNHNIIEFFQKCNSIIRQLNLKRIYMALTVYKIHNNTLTLSSAGMPPLYRYIASEKRVEEISPKGMPLGAVDRFPYQCERRHLGKKDVLLFMSDGFPELFNAEKEMIGYGAVAPLLQANAHLEPRQLVEALLNHIEEWTQGQSNDDDITFVIIKID